MRFLLLLFIIGVGVTHAELVSQKIIHVGSPLTNNTQLEDKWDLFIVQEQFRKTLEQSLQNVDYQIEVESGLLPTHFSIVLQDDSIDIHTIMQHALNSYIENFEELKQHWMLWVQNEQFGKRDDRVKQLFYSEFPEGSYDQFLDRSYEILCSIKPVCSMDEQVPIQPITFNKKKLSGMLCGWDPVDGKAKEVAKTAEGQLFFNLPLTDDDRNQIRKLIISMADRNVLQLLMDRKSMEKRGDQVRHVHPLRFIGFILGDPHLRRSLKAIRGAVFKWSAFIDGFEERMEEEFERSEVLPYVQGFAEYLDLDPRVVHQQILAGTYGSMIEKIIR